MKSSRKEPSTILLEEKDNVPLVPRKKTKSRRHKHVSKKSYATSQDKENHPVEVIGGTDFSTCPTPLDQNERHHDSPTKDEINARTLVMNKFVQHLLFHHHYDDGIIQVAGKEYVIITSKITRFSHRKTPLISCGSSINREFIILDPANAPLLREKYNDYKANIMAHFNNSDRAPLKINTLINLTRIYMRENVFREALSKSNLVDEKIQAYKLNPSFPPLKAKDGKNEITCVPIDFFIAHQAGVCRHHALVAAYLLDRFIRGHANKCGFTGKVQVMRDNVDSHENSGQPAAHSWVSLVIHEDAKESVYTLDSMNNLYGSLDDIAFTSLFGRRFGKHTIDHQLKKAGKLRR